MRKIYFRLLCLLPILFPGPAWGAQRIKNVKVAVSNPSPTARSAADIVIPIAGILKVAPDFKPGAVIVTVSDASTLEEDAALLRTEELPSQLDDLDGAGKADELAFQVDLAPHQSRIVTISYGEGARIWRLRSDYKQRTAALFSRKIEGLGWESERVAFRIYFDPRNAIDIYGRNRPPFNFPITPPPGTPIKMKSPEGRACFKEETPSEKGPVRPRVTGNRSKRPDVMERKWLILASGPVRSIVAL